MRSHKKKRRKSVLPPAEAPEKGSSIWVFWFWVVVICAVIYFLGGLNGFFALRRSH